MEVEANTSGQTQAKTKFCKHCGGTIPQDAVMCTHCGRQVEKLAGGDGSVRPVYLSEELAPGPHTVTLRSKTPFNLDSVAVWP